MFSCIVVYRVYSHDKALIGAQILNDCLEKKNISFETIPHEPLITDDNSEDYLIQVSKLYEMSADFISKAKHAQKLLK